MELTAKKTDNQVVNSPFPEDWKVISLGELFDFKNGLNKEKKFFGYGTPIVNYMDVYKNRGLRSSDILGKVSLSKNEIKPYEVKKGDIFFTRTSETVEEIGMSSVVLDDVYDTVFSGFVLRARPKSDVVISDYLKYCFSTSQVRKDIMSKASYTTRALTNGRLLSDVKIAIPPNKSEQLAIANSIGDADTLIVSLEKLIEKKKLIKQGVMKSILKPKQNWIYKRVGNVADVTTGGTPSTYKKEYWDGNIRWMNSGELNLKRVSEVENRITELGLASSATKLIPPHCVLIGLAGQGKTRGTVAMNMVELCTNQSIGAILPNSEIHHDYLYHYLDSKYNELRNLSTGDGGRGGLNLSIIKNLEIPVPAMVNGQIHIANILNDMDAEIIVLEKKLLKQEQLKQGMMQNLLTGKIRLV